MSAPDTNIGKQKRRHRPAIWGLWAGFFLAVAIGLVIYAFAGSSDAAVAPGAIPAIEQS